MGYATNQNRTKGIWSSRGRDLFVQALGSLLVGLLAFGCKPKSEAAKPPQQADKIMVFAAASLRDVFTGMSAEFRRVHTDTQVEFNFAGTQELRTQVEQGAEADVFASADQKHMGELVKGGKVAAPTVFAKNEPVLAVSHEASAKIRGFGDLPQATRIIIGVPEVPIGRYTLQILERANSKLGGDFRSRVEARVISRELNVKQIYSKVSMGEADVGIVYRTDVKATDSGVKILAIPAEFNVIAEYPIAVISQSKHSATAKEWVDFVTSPTGRALLEKAGFATP